MAKFQATFESKRGKSTMVVEGLSQSDAKDVASFFELSRGKVVSVKPIAK